MEKQDSKGTEDELEEEIDQAVDSLFVEKGARAEQAPSPPTDRARSEGAGTLRIESGPPSRQLEEEIDQAVDSLFADKPARAEQAPSLPTDRARSEGAEPAEVELGSPGRELEQEIDHAIDNLFIEKGVGTEPAASQPTDEAPPKAAEPPEVELGPPPKLGIEEPSEEEKSSFVETERPTRNLENLETHLLSLEWEISSDLIDKIVTELGFLKKAYGNDRALFQVFEVMGKVAHSLADDEGNITPESLRFLLDAKDGVNLFRNELRDKEDYKNLFLSGILARYSILQDQNRISGEAGAEPVGGEEIEGLTQTLKALSQQLRDQIRQLGAVTRKLQGDHGASVPLKTVGTVLVTSSGRVFAIERDMVVRSVQIPYRMVRTIWRDNEIRIRGSRFPLVNLFRLFGFKGKVEAEDKTVILIRKADRTLALLADKLLQKKEIPSASIREEKRLAYIRGIASMEPGRKIYLLDADRLMVEF